MRGKKSNWMYPYNLAKAYYKHHGDLDVPSTFRTVNGYEEIKNDEEVKKGEKIFDLGRWISKQRYGNVENENYNITDEHRELLNKIKMIWGDVNEYRWNKRYELAKAYYKHHGDLDIPSTFKTINGYEEIKDGEKVKRGERVFDLGKWIKDQRSAYNKAKKNSLLRKEKGKKLNDTETIWDFNKYKWNKFLDEEKIKKLDDIEMIWDINKYRWNKMYELAKAYYKHHGHLNVPKTFRTKNGYTRDENGYKLGDWIDTQRRKYSGQIKGILTDKQLKLLEELDISWFVKKDEEYQKEQITSTNKYRKQIEIYNRFRTYLNNISNDTNMPSIEEINQGFIDQLDGKNSIKNKQKVNSLEKAMDETIKDYGYDKLTDRVKQLIYCIILHVDSMDQDEYAYRAFTEKNGARAYIKSKGKTALIEEIKQSLNINAENTDGIGNIYKEYANDYYAKKYNKEEVNSLEKAIDETVKDYEYERNPDRLEILIYCLISHIDRIDQYEDANLAFTEKNGARAYIKSKGKTALIEEMYYSLALNNENVDSIVDIYQEYANSYYNKKYNKELPNKKKF